jgi:hypothetical protein
MAFGERETLTHHVSGTMHLSRIPCCILSIERFAFPDSATVMCM